MKTIMLTAAAALLSSSSLTFAASEADCTTLWTKADVKKEGKLSGDGLKAYYEAAEAAQIPMGKDKTILTDKEFMDFCVKDAFKSMKQ